MKKILLLLAVLLIFSCSKDEGAIDDKQEKIPEIFALSISVSPSEGGSITGGEENYKDGEDVTLIATPSEEFEFKEWQGDVTGSENPTTFVMSSNKEVVAVFTKKVYFLDFNILGKWYFPSPSTSSTSQENKISNKQSENSSCSILSIEFREDDTYTMVTDKDEVEGKYVITSNSSIDLGSGRIENLTFINDVLSFTLTLDSGCSSKPSTLPITYVPDDVFEQILITNGLDEVLDNYVLTENIKEISSLSYDGKGRGKIKSLTGIEAFEGLHNLAVTFNEIDSINITQNLNLSYLDLEGNNLTSIDVSKNKKLTDINLKSNLIEAIHFQNINPIWISLMNNPLKMAEFTDVRLYQLDIYDTPLEKLVFTNFSAGELHVQNNPQLTHIEFNNSQLTFIARLANNNLQQLDVSESPTLEHLNATGNSFTCIKVNSDQLGGNDYWELDEGVVLSLNCN